MNEEKYDAAAHSNRLYAEAMKVCDSIDDKINNYKTTYIKIEVPNKIDHRELFSKIAEIENYAIKLIDNNEINVEIVPMY